MTVSYRRFFNSATDAIRGIAPAICRAGALAAAALQVRRRCAKILQKHRTARMRAGAEKDVKPREQHERRKRKRKDQRDL